VTEAVHEGLRAHRMRRAGFAADPAHLLDVLRSGNAAANKIAETTLTEVRRAMSMDY
jgi:tryptophanyl-tRNA synthetase